MDRECECVRVSMCVWSGAIAVSAPPVRVHLPIHLVGRHAGVLHGSLRDVAPELELAPLAFKPALVNRTRHG